MWTIGVPMSCKGSGLLFTFNGTQVAVDDGRLREGVLTKPSGAGGWVSCLGGSLQKCENCWA